MDKSLGANLQLWRFFTRAKQTVMREFIYTCSASSKLPPPPHNVGHVYTLFLQSFNIVFGGGGGGVKAARFKVENSAFEKIRFKITEN